VEYKFDLFQTIIMDSLITEIEQLAKCNEQTAIDIDSDWDGDGEKNGNIEDKISMLQQQINLLLAVAKELKKTTDDVKYLVHSGLI